MAEFNSADLRQIRQIFFPPKFLPLKYFAYVKKKVQDKRTICRTQEINGHFSKLIAKFPIYIFLIRI